jgi:transcriptional regulator with XRE-family HTH domain
MLSPATLLNALIIAAHDGSNAAFCEKHGVKKQTISSLTNGTGNSKLSFAKLEQWANADGYTVGTILHKHTGDHITDALAFVRAAAMEARHILECQDDLTPEMRDQMDFLDKILDYGQEK